ncbi:MAG: glucokinase, partial [Candidatus Binatia bacterium]
PWVVRAKGLGHVIGCKRVQLINDLEAMAYGALFLSAEEMRVLNRGRDRQGNRAVIAAGTGLGQAVLCWHDGRFQPMPTEGGHADFAPRNDKEVALLVFLQKKFPTVSYERVLSGPGLFDIFTFFDRELGRPVSPEVRERLKTEDPGRVIGEAGIAGTCPASVEAVETFIEVYGAQAGNLALSAMAVGGVFVGGAIAFKLLAKIESGAFLKAFRSKGRYRDFMSDIPVKVLLNADAGLVGASHAAAELV